MSPNTISNKLELTFDMHSHRDALIKISAPSQADINSINGILYASFSYMNEKKRFSWEFEEGWDDGIDYVYNKACQTLPLGLIPRAVKYLKESRPNLKINVSDSIRKIYSNPNGDITIDQVKTYADSLNIYNRIENVKITPYEHQLRLVQQSLNRRRVSLLACTSAGKSLSMYINVRYLTEVERKQVLVVVPSTNLVKQLFTDFQDDYGWEKARDSCTLIYGQSEDKLTTKQKAALKELNLGEEAILKPITISTWQSLQNKPPEFFDVFEAVMVDEAHGTRGAVLRDILGLCKNSTEFKIGLSGTLPDDGLDAAWIEGALGQKIVIVRLKELIALGILTPVEIHTIKVPYEEKIRPYICKQNYQSEYSLLTNNDSRKRVMDLLIKAKKITTDENTVMLYKNKGTLDEMYEYLKEAHPQFKYHIIKGEIDVNERERIRKEMENGGGNIIIATYGTMKQGVNIKLLHNLVFAEFSKSMYEVVQSIGRIVRPHKDKKLARVFDIVDDASYTTKPRKGGFGKSKLNYGMKHYETRKFYYADDDIPVIELDLTGIYEATINAADVEKKKEAAKKRAAAKKSKKKSTIKGKGSGSKFLN